MNTSPLKCSTSLWSADLANLADEIRRVEPFTERFHLDVADGHYVSNMLFFPDQVRALRAHTEKPFEVHLMVDDPIRWVEPFVEAGADSIIFCHDSVKDPKAVLRHIRKFGKEVGVSLLVSEPIDVLDSLWAEIDLLVIVGTAMGVKGASLDALVPDKIRRAKREIRARGLNISVQADGGIRRETVPILREAGADFIVPGSLMFKEDPSSLRAWLATLP